MGSGTNEGSSWGSGRGRPPSLVLTRMMHVTTDKIPQYIAALEKAQLQVSRAEMPIPDNYLMMVATKAMLSSERFPRANEDWEDLKKVSKLWRSLTYINAAKYCPLADKTIKGHMVQTRQGVQSTKPKNLSKRGVQELLEIDEPTPGNDSVNELYVQVVQKHILYTDDTGRFPIRARSGNQYVMVAYHSSNIILV